MRYLLIIITSSLICSSLAAESGPNFSYEGHANTWALYLTDNFDATSVIDVYSGASCDSAGDLDFSVIGKDRSLITACDTRCCIERVIRNGETIVERMISSDGTTLADRSIKTGDSFLGNLAINAKAQKDHFYGKLNSNATGNFMEQRALYGSKAYRLRMMDAYLGWEKDKWDISGGRKAILGGVLIDGVDANYRFGDGDQKTEKSFGVFGGLSPHPITKYPRMDAYTFGAKFHFIPEFSSKTESKWKFDTALVGEYFEGEMNRFYLFTQSQFSPTWHWAFLLYSTLELPAEGDGSTIESSHFSLQSIYRANEKWTLSTGFSQFKVDRILREESVRWLTDSSGNQSTRLGDTLDRSNRYRFDLKLSYKPVYFVNPYIQARYERRTFDDSKRLLNEDPGSADPTPENLVLLNRKNAYMGRIGVRSYPWEALDTESIFTYNRRFNSKAYDFYQSLGWEDAKWGAEVYGQVVWSDRDLQNSVPDVQATKVDATDYYLGISGSYKILAKLTGQLQYDLSNEDDYSIGSSILTHSILARLDCRF